MITGVIGKYGKFRLWRDVYYPSLYEISNDQDVHDSCVNGTTPDNAHNAVLEVMIPRGARVLYGMLGVRYLPAGAAAIRGDDLKSTISIFSENENYLIKGFDSVSVGLPENYAKAALDGFRRASFDCVEVEINRLQIIYAAHGEVSSNERIFEKIGFVLAKLIAGACNGDFEESISSMFESDVKGK